MPPTQLTMSLCSRQRDALKRLLHDQGIDDQPHRDLDFLLHILLVRMRQEGWSIDTRGRLMTPEQTKNAQRAAEVAILRRNEDVRNPVDGEDLRTEINAKSQAAEDGRTCRDSWAYTPPYSDIDGLPRPPPLVALPPPFVRAGSDRRGTGMQRAYVPYMERGSTYRSGYQDSNTNKHYWKGRPKEETDGDPHYVEEDAVFEFWLANIWKPAHLIKAQEERKEIVLNKKGWFRGLWTGKK
ncbi:hypothetical protein Vi05172_g13094 [Venturia inaequalis]|nr:hypothetical protein Vi05172_g13094 [Venturia inaequalis]